MQLASCVPILDHIVKRTASSMIDTISFGNLYAKFAAEFRKSSMAKCILGFLGVHFFLSSR